MLRTSNCLFLQQIFWSAWVTDRAVQPYKVGKTF